MDKKQCKKRFLELIDSDFFNRISISHNWDKMHQKGLNNDFLFNGELLTFPEFAVEIADMHAQTETTDTPIIKKHLPSTILKFTGNRNPREITSYLTDKGYPMGYIEQLNEDGDRNIDYSQHFGILDDHSFFYEDILPHKGKAVATYVDLRDQSVYRFTEDHEAYYRIIKPAIQKIEDHIAKFCIAHAPVTEAKLKEI